MTKLLDRTRSAPRASAFVRACFHAYLLGTVGATAPKATPVPAA